MLHLWRHLGQRGKLLKPRRRPRLVADIEKVTCFEFELLSPAECAPFRALRHVAFECDPSTAVIAAA